MFIKLYSRNKCITFIPYIKVSSNEKTSNYSLLDKDFDITNIKPNLIFL